MRLPRALLVLAVLLIAASFSCGEIMSVYTDTEVSTGNRFTGWTSLRWTQTTATDFSNGALQGVEVLASGEVRLAQSAHPRLFVLVGGGSSTFLSYDVLTGTWSTLASTPVGVGDGASLEHDGGRYIYALAGGGSRGFGRYDIESNTWTALASTPASVGQGGDLVLSGSTIFALRGDSRDIWRYDIASDSWSALPRTPSTMGAGGSMVLEGGHLMVLRGGNSRDHWRYTIATGQWSTILRAPSNIRGGGDSTDGPGTYEYALQGSNQRGFWRYDAAANSWATLSSTPDRVNAGGCLVYDGGQSVYVLEGGSGTAFWMYDIPGNRWYALTSVPMAVRAGGAVEFVSSGSAYSGMGTVTSAVLDTGQAGTRYDYVSWDANAPAGTAMTMEIRASDTLSAGQPDAAWSSPSSSFLSSGLPSGRYVQWRATLTASDPGVSPVLQEVRLYFFGG